LAAPQLSQPWRDRRSDARRNFPANGLALIRILYFAWLRERTGCAEESVALPAGVSTVGELIAHLRSRSPGYHSAFAHPRLVRCAVNQHFASSEASLAAGDEVAFFPPVTGG
jgi:molybdopterin synthase sulfur carrier subunit